MRHSTTLTLLVSLALTACATKPETTASESTQSKLICEKISPTGSRIAQRFCWTSEEAANAQADAKRFKEIYERTPSIESKGP